MTARSLQQQHLSSDSMASLFFLHWYVLKEPVTVYFYMSVASFEGIIFCCGVIM